MQTTTKPKTINRRTAIKTGAAMGAMGVAPAAANADAELIGMWRQYEATEAEIERLLDTVEKVRGQYPDLDTAPAVAVPYNVARTIDQWKIDPEAIKLLQSTTEIEALLLGDQVDCREAAMAYRDALMAELEDRIKARAALMEKSGIGAMNDRIEALDDAGYRLCERILETPAHGLDGLIVRLRALVRLGRGGEDYSVEQLEGTIIPNAERILGVGI